MRKELLTLAVLATITTTIAAEINLTEISQSVDFFGGKVGVTNGGLVAYGFLGGGLIVALIVIAFVGIVFYKWKYSSKTGGTVKEQDLFQKYNY